MVRDYLICVGANFKTAPLAVRERLAFSPTEVLDALRLLKEHGNEAFILSTCNRTELYLVSDNLAQARTAIKGFLRWRSNLSHEESEQVLFDLVDDAAVVHLLQVAAGMDSLIVGEHEILAQLRKAHQHASQARTLGPVLSRLCQMALRAGKRARTETPIGRHAASVSLAAVRLAQGLQGELRHQSILVLGAGAAARLVAHALSDYGAGKINVASRRIDTARALADSAGGVGWSMTSLAPLLLASDVVISCTGATDVVVPLHLVQDVQRRRGYRPLLLLDLAVPRDIAPEARNVPGVTLYDLDDMKAICERNHEARRAALEQVGDIVEEEATNFLRWWDGRQSGSSLTRLRTWAEDIRQKELGTTLRKLATLSPAEQQAVESLTRALVNKLLHPPTAYLKQHEGTGADRMVAQVFGLDPAGEDAAATALAPVLPAKEESYHG